MCLYPNKIKNKKYYPTKKNGYSRDITCADERKLYILVPCGNCIECRRQIANNWRIRLGEEIKTHKYNHFVTLTFSDESLNDLTSELGVQECNAVAAAAVRKFLERYRKKYKKSVRHWLITELGHEGTERIHLHGLIMRDDAPLTKEELLDLWKYGYADPGKYVNARTINYIIKYVTKYDNDHIGYKPSVFCSAGMGKNYISRATLRYHQFQGKETSQHYVNEKGYKIALPKYYRQKIYQEEERDELWSIHLDENNTYVNGIEIKNINTPEGDQQFHTIMKTARKVNIDAGFGQGYLPKVSYNVRKHDLLKKKRIDKYNQGEFTTEILQEASERLTKVHIWETTAEINETLHELFPYEVSEAFWDAKFSVGGGNRTALHASVPTEEVDYLQGRTWKELAKAIRGD